MASDKEKIFKGKKSDLGIWNHDEKFAIKIKKLKNRKIIRYIASILEEILVGGYDLRN